MEIEYHLIGIRIATNEQLLTKFFMRCELQSQDTPQPQVFRRMYGEGIMKIPKWIATLGPPLYHLP